MKPKSTLRHFLSIASSALLAISYVHAATLYWDGGTVSLAGNGNGLSLGTPGDWDATLTNWDAGSGLPYAAWVNGNNDTAFFGGTAGTVTLTAPVSVGGLTFAQTGYTIAAGTQGLSFGASDDTIRLFNPSGVATISATISGTVGGAGNVTLSSLNTNVASTLILSGTSTGGWGGTTTLGPSATLSISGLNQGLNSTTGSITLNGGNILLTNAAGTAVDNERISSAAITAAGGTLNLANTIGANVYAETIGSVALTSGQTSFTFNNTQGASLGSQTLTLGGLTRTGATNTSSVLFASNSGLSADKNIMQVTAATQTTAGQINAPWAYAGNTAGAFDYAVYDASGNVLGSGATLVAGGEAAWTVATDAYNNNVGTQTLGATRTIAALRNTAATATLTLATDANLETKGLLNGVGTLLTVAPGTGGALTTPTGGGNLHINAGNGTTGGAVTISAPINDKGLDAVTVVKDGLGTLTLSSITSNYSGGTVVNAGSLTWTANTNLGLAGSRNITVNGVANLNGFDGTSLNALSVGSGGVATLTNLFSYTFTSASGSGTIRSTGGNGKVVSLGNASAFTGNLALAYNANNNSTLYTNPHLTFSSLNDAVGSSLQFYRIGGGTDSGQVGQVGLTGDVGAVTFNNRQIQLLPQTSNRPSTGSVVLINNNATAANSWIVGTPLLNHYDRTVQFHLAGTNTGLNAFNGTIGDSSAGFALTVVKGAAGTWILGGNNTHSGGTTLSTGKLNINHAGALGTGTFTIGAATFDNTTASTIINANNNAIAWNGDATFTGTRSLNLGTGNAVLGGNRGIVVSANALTFGGVVSGAFNITLGGNGRLILSNAASTYSGKTVVGNNGGSVLTLQVSKLDNLSQNSSLGAPTTAALGLIQLGSQSHTSTLDYIGTTASSTDRQVQIGSAANGSGAAVINNNSVDAAHTLTFSNAAFNVAAGGANTSSRSIRLGGSNTGDNTVSGAIVNNTGSTVSVGVTKQGSGTWVLNGLSSYTGGTSVENGILKVNTIKDATVNSAVGAGTIIAFGGATSTGTLEYTGAGDSSDRNVRIGTTTVGNTGGGVLNSSGAGALTFTALNPATPFNTAVAGVTTSRNLTLGGSYTGGINEIQGAIVDNDTGTGGTVSIAKSDASTWMLSGTNSYTGATTVSGGKLFVNGDQTSANGALSVAALATLGGSGTIGGNTTIDATGKLEFNLSTIPGSHDKLELAATKTLTFSGASSLTITSSGGATTGLYTLVTAPGAFSILGTDPAIVGLPVGWTADPPQIVADGPNTSLQINITSTGTGATAYGTWATSKGLTGLPGSATDPAKDADPDKDGRNNIGEFAFNGDPLSGSDNGKVYVLTEDSNIDALKELILTVAVRTGTPTFVGSPSPSAIQAADGITYSIEGSLDLASFLTQVNVVAPITTGLPVDPGTGYEYRSFSLNGSNGLTGKGFLRAKVTSP